MKLQLKELEKIFYMNEAEIKVALESLPEKLSDSYRQLLEDIGSRQKPDQVVAISRILARLTFSSQPMTLPQLIDVAQITTEAESKMAENNRLAKAPDIFRRMLQKRCRDLIAFEHSAEGDGHKTLNEEVKLAHLSVRDYLVSSLIKQEDSTAQRFSLAEGNGGRVLAELCVACMLHFDNRETFGPDSIEQHPFPPYSGQYLGLHAKAANEVAERGRLDDLLFELFHQNETAFVNWHRLCDPPNPLRGACWELLDHPHTTKGCPLEGHGCWRAHVLLCSLEPTQNPQKVP